MLTYLSSKRAEYVYEWIERVRQELHSSYSHEAHLPARLSSDRIQRKASSIEKSKYPGIAQLDAVIERLTDLIYSMQREQYLRTLMEASDLVAHTMHPLCAKMRDLARAPRRALR